MENTNDDPFCPRHGRASRPTLTDGLRCDCSSNERARIFEDITAERQRQQEKFGDHSVAGVLMEEVGEVAKELIEQNNPPTAKQLRHLRAELIQVAAVAVAWVEAIRPETLR